MTIQVTNFKDVSTEIKKKYGNLFEYWIKKSKQKINYCSSHNCFNPSETAVLLQRAPVTIKKKVITDKNWYIAPFCKSCGADQNSENIIDIVDYVELVPVK